MSLNKKLSREIVAGLTSLLASGCTQPLARTLLQKASMERVPIMECVIDGNTYQFDPSKAKIGTNGDTAVIYFNDLVTGEQFTLDGSRINEGDYKGSITPNFDNCKKYNK